VLLPTSCPVCRRPGPAPCPACAATLRPAPPRPPPPGVDGCRAVLAYDGAGRELVARLKYRNARSSIAWLAGRMAAAVGSLAGGEGPALVTWVPTSAARRRDRGFDQAELLARAVARRLGLRCRALIARAHGPPQTGRSLVERRIGPSFRAPRAVPAAVVILVDDVVTTGSTLSAAARTLRGAGASRVVVVAAARTPYRAWSARDDAKPRRLGSGDPVSIKEGRE
jgi:ComF family protein